MTSIRAWPVHANLELMPATKLLVSVEEYLRTSFDGPDREFVSGETVERNVGEKPHSQAQTRLAAIFEELRKSRPLYAFTELRLRLGPETCRIPDLAVFAGQEPEENVPSVAPLVAVEIVSREDRYTEILGKLEEYRAWGVAHVWLVDPWMSRLYVYGAAGLSEVPAFRLPEFGVEIEASRLF